MERFFESRIEGKQMEREERQRDKEIEMIDKEEREWREDDLDIECYPGMESNKSMESSTGVESIESSTDVESSTGIESRQSVKNSPSMESR